jgi:hypothetical protein
MVCRLRAPPREKYLVWARKKGFGHPPFPHLAFGVLVLEYALVASLQQFRHNQPHVRFAIVL